MNRSAFVALPLLLCLVQGDQHRPGYDDTPYLPGGQWRVHDKSRPYPRVVHPGDGTAAPSDAIVLFDGTSLDAWAGKDGKPQWTIDDGSLLVTGGGPLHTKQKFGSCQLHIEWRTPAKIKGNGQGRGNSGVFLMSRYEVQVLDSYDNPTYADGQAAAIYGQYPPLVNACRKPGEWQTYDIVFDAPKFEGEKLVKPAYFTVFHNGVLVHDHDKVIGATAHRKLAHYSPHGKAPLQLQDHGNPVRYRNIWIRPLD